MMGRPDVFNRVDCSGPCASRSPYLWLAMLLCVSELLGGVACSDRQSPRASKARVPAVASSGAGTPPAPIVQRTLSNDATTVAWTTSLGPGGAEIPPWPSPPTDEEASLGFSRLLGVIFPPERNEILLVGVREEPDPPLVFDELVDALAVSLRALPGAPGVSIDPTGPQLSRGLRENDPMAVRYIGGDRDTIVGQVTFEADRLMKNLSLGMDNVSKNPVTSAVPGYRNELDLSLDSPGGGREEWHRFWIEQVDSPLRVSRDGRAVLLDTRLGVRTEYMQVADGRLVSGNRAPSRTAAQFAGHLTERYRDYAREFRVYQDLQAFAQMTALAEAMTSDSVPRELAEARSAVDVEWLANDYSIRATDTPATTPAVVARKARRSGNTEHTVVLTGGVDLAPKVRYLRGDADASQLQQDVLADAARSPGKHFWTTRSAGRTIAVTRRRLVGSTVRLWQTDMTVGPLRFERESTGPEREGELGRHWRVRLPELHFSTEAVELESMGRMPRSVAFTATSGKVTTLARHARLRMPGLPETSGFMNATGRRRELYLFRNRFLLTDGEPRFVSVDNGPLQMELLGDVTVVEFSATAPHRPQKITTSGSDVEVLWRDNRFEGYRARTGESIKVRYDERGRIVGLRGSDGQVVDYRFDADGRLRAVVDAEGRSISYRLPDDGGMPTGVWAEFPGMTGGARISHGRLEIGPTDWTTLLKDSATLSSNDTTFVALREAPAGAAQDYDVSVGGKVLPPQGNLGRQVEAVLSTETGGVVSKGLKSLADAIAGRSNVVIVGPPGIRSDLARALETLAPRLGLSGAGHEVSISTASDARLAAKNLASDRRGGRGYEYLPVSGGLEPDIKASLDRLPRGSTSAGLIIVSGHLPAVTAAVTRLSEEGRLKGRTVLLITCGSYGDGVPDILLRDGDARQVITFDQPINQRFLEPLVAGIQSSLARSGSGASDVKRAIDGAIDEMRRGNLSPLLKKDDVKVLELRRRQIGDMSAPGESGFQPRPVGRRWLA